MEDWLMHKGTPHEGLIPHSGRYAWGSGEHSFQRLDDGFTQMVRNLRKQGLSDEEIVKGLGLNNLKQLHEREATAKVVAMREAGKSVEEIAKATDLKMEVVRNKITIAKEHNRAILVKQAQELAAKGVGATEGAKIMGLKNESSFRSLLDDAINERSNATTNVANLLKKELETKQYLDVGAGTEITFGVTETKLKAAIQMLEEQGYERYNIYKEQMGIKDNKTTTKTLCPPGTTIKEVYDNYDKIEPVGKNRVVDDDGQVTALGLEPFTSVKSKRVACRYAEEGGESKDGVIEIRRGVDDLSLGRANYAQVRIAVDGTHYLKGMAIYGEDKDFPPGVDIIFNTNKKVGTPLLVKDDPEAKQVLKVMKTDEANPFGATIKTEDQRVFTQKKGSAINIVNEEGDWENWSKTLASQFLSKQPVDLAKKQLSISYADKLAERDEIMKITNPTLRKRMLTDFAADCDASAVHLKAAHLPGQAAKVLLPVPSLPDGQIYAPHLRNGERVVLVRYPHGGKFEIPELVVNNNHPPSKRMLGNPKDAVGINIKTAQQLSGADFDGDTALVIPVTRNGRRTVNIQTKPPLDGLKDFDPKDYALPNTAPRIKGATKQREMGKVSNLITDMTIKGATDDEIERAVRHSMVVIDSEKHHLDYKKSFKDNNIAELKKLYQEGGASTIVSRAKSTERIPTRYDTRHIDPKTGEIIYRETGKTYKNKSGEEKPVLMEVTRMSTAKDARELMSKHPTQMEIAYATYANQLKSLANDTRKETLRIKDIEVNKSMTQKYAKEVESLKHKLELSNQNKPKERLAQRIANQEYEQRVKDTNKDLDNEDLKKIRGQALAGARARVGAKKTPFVFTDKEWEAVQAGAIPKTTLNKMFDAADADHLRRMATPKSAAKITPGMIARIKAMANSPAYTISDVAKALGVSTSTVSKYMK